MGRLLWAECLRLGRGRSYVHRLRFHHCRVLPQGDRYAMAVQATGRNIRPRPASTSGVGSHRLPELQETDQGRLHVLSIVLVPDQEVLPQLRKDGPLCLGALCSLQLPISNKRTAVMHTIFFGSSRLLTRTRAHTYHLPTNYLRINQQETHQYPSCSPIIPRNKPKRGL